MGTEKRDFVPLVLLLGLVVISWQLGYEYGCLKGRWANIEQLASKTLKDELLRRSLAQLDGIRPGDLVELEMSDSKGITSIQLVIVAELDIRREMVCYRQAIGPRRWSTTRSFAEKTERVIKQNDPLHHEMATKFALTNNVPP